MGIEQKDAALGIPYTRIVVRAHLAQAGGQNLETDQAGVGGCDAHGLLCRRHYSPGLDLPLLPDTLLRRGDVITLSGRSGSVEALAGAQTEAVSMNKIIGQSGSNTPVIGFTVCYAISNVLLAVCGPVIIALTIT
ncbi:YidE/YbjL duplication [Pseudomonas putida]|uniref:Uncharacterized protein n=1 Tax=Pseudomonas putida NBRC 14164 TaxID=1211579 RepID=A0ABM7EGL6_PSEPU|nr:hypothetical protein PP4_30950 [Pseudomonas putida NBRC 14164]SUD75728.1 YidE/YbjL duplication [Pseudomonas putida]